MKKAFFITAIFTSIISNGYANSRCGLHLTTIQTQYIEKRLSGISSFFSTVRDYSVEKHNHRYSFTLKLTERFQLPAEVKAIVLTTGTHVKWTSPRGYTYDSSPYTIKKTGENTVTTFAALYPKGITSASASPWAWKTEYVGSGLFLEAAIEDAISEALKAHNVLP